MITWKEVVDSVLEFYGNNEEIFIADIEALDDINGYLDGYRCYPMDEISELLAGLSIGEFLDRVNYFDKDDAYFYVEASGWINSASNKEYDVEYLNENFVDELYSQFVSVQMGISTRDMAPICNTVWNIFDEYFMEGEN